MGLESANTIATLDSSWPLISDKRSEGDDHLRLIKSVLKAQFPGSSGNGFATPLTVTEAELNALHNKVVDAFPSGTRLLFQQKTAPLGWTLDTDLDSRSIYVSSTAPSGSTDAGAKAWFGGLHDALINTVVSDHVHTQQGTFTSSTSSQNIDHSHTIGPFDTFNAAGGGTPVMRFTGSGGTQGTSSVNGGANVVNLHSHFVTISGFTTGASSGNTANYQPFYCTVIIAQKN